MSLPISCYSIASLDTHYGAMTMTRHWDRQGDVLHLSAMQQLIGASTHILSPAVSSSVPVVGNRLYMHSGFVY